ncbi:hypothetical protein ACFQ48_18825 [Hymenobacter caeli]|uniref:XRE family transcriptional regulator n=1 Tax=Hymenobacter caeli TaxID=2735894 RepID=A0ABX2FXJ9_9BACT|nr:XRE family transcriptional regulator [Hymenobacter caeli]NRT21004.1 hypothetical protein [Hymenobacter caeli]
MLYRVDTELLASLVRTKRAGQTLREAAEEITRTIVPVSVGTLLRVEQQKVPDLPVFLHLCNWLAVAPGRLLYGPSPVTAATETTATTVVRLLRSDKRLEPAMANVLAIMIEATYAQLSAHE